MAVVLPGCVSFLFPKVLTWRCRNDSTDMNSNRSMFKKNLDLLFIFNGLILVFILQHFNKHVICVLNLAHHHTTKKPGIALLNKSVLNLNEGFPQRQLMIAYMYIKLQMYHE